MLFSPLLVLVCLKKNHSTEGCVAISTGRNASSACEDCTMVFLIAHTSFNMDECNGKELKD